MGKVKSFLVDFVMFFFAFFIPNELLDDYHIVIQVAASVVLLMNFEAIKNAGAKLLQNRKQNANNI